MTLIALALGAGMVGCVGSGAHDGDAELDVPAGPVAEPPFVVIAHRGYSARAPEHTMSAYELAVDAGADYIEQDLQMTSDGVLVALHDPTLDRTARGEPALCTGPVIERTFREIWSCDFASWFAEEHPDAAGIAAEPIPSLQEVFDRFGHDVRYYIETKNPEEAPGMERELVRLLAASGLLDATGSPPPVMIQSFSEESLRLMRTLAPALPRVQLIGSVSSDSLRALLPSIAEYADGIGPQFRAVDSILVAEAHALGLVVHPYTVNEPGDLQRMREAGADGIFTNEVELARTTR